MAHKQCPKSRKESKEDLKSKGKDIGIKKQPDRFIGLEEEGNDKACEKNINVELHEILHDFSEGPTPNTMRKLGIKIKKLISLVSKVFAVKSLKMGPIEFMEGLSGATHRSLKKVKGMFGGEYEKGSTSVMGLKKCKGALEKQRLQSSRKIMEPSGGIKMHTSAQKNKATSNKDCLDLMLKTLSNKESQLLDPVGVHAQDLKEVNLDVKLHPPDLVVNDANVMKVVSDTTMEEVPRETSMGDVRCQNGEGIEA